MARGNKKKGSKGSHSSKTTYVQDSDGWTHVIKGPAAVQIDRAALSSTIDGSDTTSTSKPAAIMSQKPWQPKVLPGHTLGPKPLTRLAELQEEHARQSKAIMGSQIMKNIRSTLIRSIKENPQCKSGIKNAICVGIGSLSASRRETSMRQLIIFETALEILYEHNCFITTTSDFTRAPTPPEEAVAKKADKFPPVPVYLQELKFTDLDADFLRSRGYNTIAVGSMSRTPSHERHCFEKGTVGPISAHMGADSFFYAPHLEFDAILNAVRPALPCLYFGNDVEKWRNDRVEILHNGTPIDEETLDRLCSENTWCRIPGLELDEAPEWCNDFVFGFRMEIVDDDMNVCLHDGRLSRVESELIEVKGMKRKAGGSDPTDGQKLRNTEEGERSDTGA